MLNFLRNLFQNKYEYSTIDSQMTAISAYQFQLTIEEEPVGQGISVCNLMTDAFNKNPRKPK